MNCPECGITILSRRVWREMTVEERRASGARQVMSGLCTRDYFRRWRGPDSRTNWRLNELIEEAEFLFSFGNAIPVVAEKLGLNQKSLSKAYYRARKRGLTTRNVPEGKRRKA